MPVVAVAGTCPTPPNACCLVSTTSPPPSFPAILVCQSYAFCGNQEAQRKESSKGQRHHSQSQFLWPTKPANDRQRTVASDFPLGCLWRSNFIQEDNPSNAYHSNCTDTGRRDSLERTNSPATKICDSVNRCDHRATTNVQLHFQHMRAPYQRLPDPSRT